MASPARIGSRDRFEWAVLDRLERIETLLAGLKETEPERLWLSKRELAQRLGMGVRWVEGQMADGLPRREVGGKVLFNLGVVEGWLVERGVLRKVGG